MNNKGLLILILLVVVGIFTVSIMQISEDTPAENIAESVNEASEDVSDGINDAIN